MFLYYATLYGQQECHLKENNNNKIVHKFFCLSIMPEKQVRTNQLSVIFVLAAALLIF